ncbi:MAG: ABC transporter ATP-binding protein [Proteobacteria bacterium]|nr:ABC transporter ATP-binding protein [Pseudomonadota bacterium]
MTGRSDARCTAALLRPHAPALGLALVLAAVVSACRGGVVLLVREVLDGLLAAGDGRALWLLPGAVVALFAVQGAARLGRTWLTRRSALQAESALRQRLFEHSLGRDPTDLQADGVGDAIARLGHDAGKIRTAVGAAVTIVQRPLTAIALLAAAFAMAPKLAVLAAIALPPMAAVITWTGRRTRETSRQHQDDLAGLLAGADDALRGLRTIQASGAADAAADQFRRADERQVGSALRSTLFRVAGPPTVELAAAVGIAAVIGIGSLQVANGTLTAGALFAFLVALGLLNEPLKGIAAAAGLWQEARGGLSRVFEALDTPSGPQDAAGATALEADRVRLELRDVAVRRGDRAVLNGLSLTAGPGSLVVISGPSGAGKSTLLDVIAGFVRPGDGSVHWNGTDAAGLTLASRRSHLALVDQAPWLGGGTIASAIAMARPDASAPAIEAAAKAAGLQLDLEVEVGDGGRPVSGGERQRIALARALLRDAPVLLLDEPTANLDATSEEAFLASLKGAAGDRTVLVVSHRPGPLAIATDAYELSDGRLHRTHEAPESPPQDASASRSAPKGA